MPWGRATWLHMLIAIARGGNIASMISTIEPRLWKHLIWRVPQGISRELKSQVTLWQATHALDLVATVGLLTTHGNVLWLRKRDRRIRK